MAPPRRNHQLSKSGNPTLSAFLLVLTVSLRSDGMSVNSLKNDQPSRDVWGTNALSIAKMLFAFAMALRAGATPDAAPIAEGAGHTVEISLFTSAMTMM